MLKMRCHVVGLLLSLSLFHCAGYGIDCGRHILRSLESDFGGGNNRELDPEALWNDPNTFTNPQSYREGDPFLFVVVGLLADHHALLHDPDLKISDFPFVSSSIITEENNGTYGPWGFVLGNVGVENVVATCPHDIGFPNDVMPKVGLKEFPAYLKMIYTSRSSYPLRPPREVVAETGDYYYIDDEGKLQTHEVNETVLLGTSLQGQRLSITALFAKVNAKGSLIPSSAQRRWMVQLSRRLGVPIIRIRNKVRMTPKQVRQLRPTGWYD